MAHDSDKTRLRPIFERITRSGASNVEVTGDTAAVVAVTDHFDRVVVDAPCTGSGTWRRRPDAKWRLKPRNVAERQKEQRDILDTAAKLVKVGGRLVYITCSLLPSENTEQVAAFLGRHGNFSTVPYAAVWRDVLPGDPPASAGGRDDTLLLTPHRHGTDGFFVAILARNA